MYLPGAGELAQSFVHELRFDVLVIFVDHALEWRSLLAHGIVVYAISIRKYSKKTMHVVFSDIGLTNELVAELTGNG